MVAGCDGHRSRHAACARDRGPRDRDATLRSRARPAARRERRHARDRHGCEPLRRDLVDHARDRALHRCALRHTRSPVASRCSPPPARCERCDRLGTLGVGGPDRPDPRLQAEDGRQARPARRPLEVVARRALRAPGRACDRSPRLEPVAERARRRVAGARGLAAVDGLVPRAGPRRRAHRGLASEQGLEGRPRSVPTGEPVGRGRRARRVAAPAGVPVRPVAR